MGNRNNPIIGELANKGSGLKGAVPALCPYYAALEQRRQELAPTSSYRIP